MKNRGQNFGSVHVFVGFIVERSFQGIEYIS